MHNCQVQTNLSLRFVVHINCSRHRKHLPFANRANFPNLHSLDLSTWRRKICKAYNCNGNRGGHATMAWLLRQILYTREAKVDVFNNIEINNMLAIMTTTSSHDCCSLNMLIQKSTPSQFSASRVLTSSQRSQRLLRKKHLWQAGRT